MGGRDFVHREKKKPKKEGKNKPVISTFETPHPEVEIIRKGKKPRDVEEE